MSVNKNGVFLLFIFLFFLNKTCFTNSYSEKVFSKTYSNFVDTYNTDNNSYIWQNENITPSNELILSWNALRPRTGKFSLYVSIKHDYWSNWYKFAEWGPNYQQTFVHSKNPFVRVKHIKVEMAKKKAKGFRIKVVAYNGADIKNLKALFCCACDRNRFSIPNFSIDLPTIKPISVCKQSQMILDHERKRDLCSPTSIYLIVNYFLKNRFDLEDKIINFANKAHDDSYLDIYGNWPLNIAQAYDSCQEKCFFKVERLNNFYELYNNLKNGIPVAVSIRGIIRGGAKVYENGHFIVVVGWDNKRKTVLCVDPAFSQNNRTSRAYKIKTFLKAWGNNISPNLSYIALPRNLFS